MKSGPICSSIDGSTIVISAATTYTVECAEDRVGGDIPNSSVWKADFNGCLAACESNPGCIDVSYIPSAPAQGPCYMKSSLQPAQPNTCVWGAKRNNLCDQTVTSGCGSTYKVECYVDHFGGLMSTTWTSSLTDCMAACDTATGCVDVSYVPGSPGPCYLKSSVGVASNSTSVVGELQVSGCTQ